MSRQAVFIEALPEGLRNQPAIDGVVSRVVELATQSMAERGLTLDVQGFLVHLAGKLSASDVVSDTLPEQLRIGDLALAYAAGQGDDRAIAVFEQCHFGEISRVAQRVLTSHDAIDELRQRLRESLFVTKAGRSPKTLDFGGRGDLKAWFRVVVVRTALNMVTRAPKEQSDGDDILRAIPGLEDDPEMSQVRAECRLETKEAIYSAFRGLETRERNLLRHALIDGLGIDAIGAIYGVHRATAARWISLARAHLLGRLRADLGARLKVEPGEVDSILRWAQSGIDLTLERCFESS